MSSSIVSAGGECDVDLEQTTAVLICHTESSNLHTAASPMCGGQRQCSAACAMLPDEKCFLEGVLKRGLDK